MFRNGQILHPLIEETHAFRHTSPRLGLSFDVRAFIRWWWSYAIGSKNVNHLFQASGAMEISFKQDEFYRASGPQWFCILTGKPKPRRSKINSLKVDKSQLSTLVTWPNHRRKALDKFRENQVRWVIGTRHLEWEWTKKTFGLLGITDCLKVWRICTNHLEEQQGMMNGDSRITQKWVLYCWLSGIATLQSKMKLPLTLNEFFRWFSVNKVDHPEWIFRPWIKTT